MIKPVFCLSVVAVLAGCALQRPPAPRVVAVPSATFAATPAEVAEESRAVLGHLGFADIASDGTSVVGRQDDIGEQASVQCPEPRVRDTDGERLRRADPQAIDLRVRVDLETVGTGTTVTVSPIYMRTYVNSFTFLTFQRRCRSSGELEREVVEQLQQALGPEVSQS